MILQAIDDHYDRMSSLFPKNKLRTWFFNSMVKCRWRNLVNDGTFTFYTSLRCRRIFRRLKFLLSDYYDIMSFTFKRRFATNRRPLIITIICLVNAAIFVPMYKTFSLNKCRIALSAITIQTYVVMYFLDTM